MSLKKIKSRNKKIKIAIIILILAILLGLFGTKIYLYTNLLLGNDLIIKLDSDKDNLLLVHNQNDDINFNIQGTTNPFCKTICNYNFIDISNNKTIDEGSFNLSTTNLISKRYDLRADKIGKGQELYRFTVSCKNIKDYLCHTKEELKTKNKLITLDYDLNQEEKQLKENSKKELINTSIELNNIKRRLDNLNFTVIEMNKSINTEELKNDIDQIDSDISLSNLTLYSLKSAWNIYDYRSINVLNNISLRELNNRIDEINLTLSNKISVYNSLIDNLNETKDKLEELKALNVTNITFNSLNEMIIRFNKLTDYFSNKSTLEYKEEIVKDFIKDLNNTDILTDQVCCFANETILNINLTKLNYIEKNNIYKEIELNEPNSKCCLYKNCSDCINNTDLNYPIILLHGHAFNKDISAEYSLDTFTAIQERLDSDGYLNAGLVLSNSENSTGILGKVNSSVTFRASYYFDIYKITGKERIIETKTDNIDTYSIRLRDIILTVKAITGKNKVTIIAHSMGGLVVRRYIQIFGSENIDKIILIGTPNKGITKDILKYCNILGSAPECNDMDKESLFMNKINNEILPDIPIYNIIGVGCDMNGETGDGIVMKKDAILDEKNNYLINGNCSGSLNYLHAEILDINKYPQLYKTIKRTLNYK